ncbi:iron(III) ABC transporter permease [Thermodesulfovibrio yellowstonii]|uniref:Iron(III) ABC transporter permease n=2 Tax=Thermodesulfovibrio yellowstonii TaxID=28262 RepID=A0A9W6LJ96_9BACT|nr:iron(III) ABC transporter permease [Thermodesulfovibrio islandicus]
MVLKILLNETVNIFDIGDIPEKAIIIDIRLPRVILAGLVGAALSCAGVTLQGIFRNPLVDPFILGISAGAAFGCAVTIGFLSFLPLQLMAFTFAVVAVMIAYGVARTQGEVSRLPLILSGVIVSAFFTAMVSIVKFLVDPHKLQSIVYWLMGSFSLADWKSVKVAAAGVLPGIVPIFLMRWRLNVMSMGEEEAKALGVNIKRERLLFIGFSTFAVAVATSLCGIIGWVGLMVPHLVRMLIGPNHKTLVPLSISAGAAFMIAADTVSRTITSFDIPVGIITALTGAPFFIYLMKRGGKEAWGK